VVSICAMLIDPHGLQIRVDGRFRFRRGAAHGLRSAVCRTSLGHRLQHAQLRQIGSNAAVVYLHAPEIHPIRMRGRNG
jgi:hypothetical protein